MSTEFERRVKRIEAKISAGSPPCPEHFPAVVYLKPGEGRERVDELLAAMDECPKCGPATLGGGPRVLVVGMPRGVVDPLSSQAVTPQHAATDLDSKIAGEVHEENLNAWPQIIQ